MATSKARSPETRKQTTKPPAKATAERASAKTKAAPAKKATKAGKAAVKATPAARKTAVKQTTAATEGKPAAKNAAAKKTAPTKPTPSKTAASKATQSKSASSKAASSKAASSKAASSKAAPGKAAPSKSATSAAAVEKLAPYRGKRDFARTPEPSGARGAAPSQQERRFVVQRHRARNLHYDFRLEIDGVLVSWAVPKGPTLDPKVRRAAFHVEDHPLDYIDFEGVIPSGEYGGGDVIVWDNGTWEPKEEDPGRAVTEGEIHAELRGEKLRGWFVLVRTRVDDGGKEQWLMLHKRDEFATDGWDPEQHPRSVMSGRTNDEVKADPEKLWRSDRPAEQAAVTLRSDDVKEEALAALAELPAAGGRWSVFGRELRVTNLEKVLFPARKGEKPITKREFIQYSAQIAPTLLPYLTGRALNMNRFPNGAQTGGFWHKELPGHAPDWLPRWDNPDADPGESRTYLVVDEPAALVWAANFGALEWHAWTSRIDQPHRPTYALVDLDPGERTTWDDLLTMARLHRTAFEHLGLTARAKLTGRRGIQIWVPIASGPDFPTTRAWVEELSRSIGGIVPELVSWKWQKGERAGLARLDYTQNAINKTLVAPYSPRPAPGAPVSTPIDWDELDDPTLRPDAFTIRTVLDRIIEKGDLFRAVLGSQQRLPRIT